MMRPMLRALALRFAPPTLLALAACGGGRTAEGFGPPDEGPPVDEPVGAPAASIPASRSDCTCGTEPGCPPCPLPAPSAPPSAARTRTAPARFPPAPITPPFERTAKPGDGVFSPLRIHRAEGEGSPIATTKLHPHKIRGDVSLLLVAVDTSRLDLELVAGTAEPEGTTVPAERRTGLVPASALDALVAVTNGGFKRRHGGHGIGIGDDVLWPASDDGCVLAERADGGYVVAPFRALAGERLAWWRQTPPCLVENGAKHPDLANEYRAKKWGGAEDGRKDIRRSAFAIGPDPAVLYFAIGEWVTAEWLADGLVAAGLTHAAELDINYSYTRFIVYEHVSSSELAVRPALLEDLKAPKREYWKEPADRDFFYLRWREP